MAQVASLTRAGIVRGAKAGQPLAVATFVYGIAFGLMAQQISLSLLEALLVSGFVFSGTAQLAMIGILAEAGGAAGVGIVAIAVTVLVMNARYFLFSAALRPWLGGLPPGRAYGSLFFLGDGNWLISMKAHDAGEADAGFLLGSGLLIFVGWMAGTALGVSAGAVAPDPRVLGLDFLLVAFAGAMMLAMTKARADLLVIAAGALAAIAVGSVASFGWAVVAAGLAGGAVAYLRVRAGIGG